MLDSSESTTGTDSLKTFIGNERGDRVVNSNRSCHSLPAGDSEHYAQRIAIATEATREIKKKALTRHHVFECHAPPSTVEVRIVDGYVVDDEPLPKKGLTAEQLVASMHAASGADNGVSRVSGGTYKLNNQPLVYVSNAVIYGDNNNIFGDNLLIVGDGNFGCGNNVRARGARNHLHGVRCTNYDTGTEGTVHGGFSVRIRIVRQKKRPGATPLSVSDKRANDYAQREQPTLRRMNRSAAAAVPKGFSSDPSLDVSVSTGTRKKRFRMRKKKNL